MYRDVVNLTVFVGLLLFFLVCTHAHAHKATDPHSVAAQVHAGFDPATSYLGVVFSAAGQRQKKGFSASHTDTQTKKLNTKHSFAHFLWNNLIGLFWPSLRPSNIKASYIFLWPVKPFCCALFCTRKSTFL